MYKRSKEQFKSKLTSSNVRPFLKQSVFPIDKSQKSDFGHFALSSAVGFSTFTIKKNRQKEID